MSLRASLHTEVGITELHHEDGRHVSRFYQHVPAADRDLTREEADAWVRSIRSLGGRIYGEREAVAS